MEVITIKKETLGVVVVETDLNTSYFFLKKTQLKKEKKSQNIIYYNYKIFSNVILPFIMQSTHAALAICTARKILCFKKVSAMSFSVKMIRVLKNLLKKFSVLRPVVL